MKVIKVPSQEELLRAMTRRAKAARGSRAALIRSASETDLRELEEEQLERRYVEGYRRKPEDPAWGELGARLAAEVWPLETWDSA
jgi:uroporphyrinogen-III synthase